MPFLSNITPLFEIIFFSAEKIRDKHLKITKHWSEFKELLDQKCLILAAFCGFSHCEDNIKKDSSNDECNEAGAPAMGAKTLCIPLEQVRIIVISCVLIKKLIKVIFFFLERI